MRWRTRDLWTVRIALAWIPCAGYFEYPFLNKRRAGGKQRYMKKSKWLIVPACHTGRLGAQRMPVVSVVTISI